MCRGTRGVNPRDCATTEVSRTVRGVSNGCRGTGRGRNENRVTEMVAGVGLQMGYSFGPQSALVVEAGYEVFNATDVATVWGLASLVGYELRISLDAGYDNQVLLGAGMGFEYLVLSPKEALAVNESTWGFVPRLRLGWRHMVTASVGLDLALDGGAGVRGAVAVQRVSGGPESAGGDAGGEFRGGVGAARGPRGGIDVRPEGVAIG